MKPYIKIIVIAAIIIVAGLIIYLAWNWFAGPATPPAQTTSSVPYFPLASLTGTSTSSSSSGIATSSGATPTIGTLTKVSDRPAAFFWVNQSTQEVFYLDQSGIVWQAEAGQKNPQITQQGVAAINFIEQSPDGNSILAAFGSPQAPSWGIYDSVDQVWRPLPANLLQAAWGADSNTLIATEVNGSNVNLVSLDLTKSPPKPKILLSDFRFLDTDFRSISSSTVLVEERSDANYQARVWGLNTRTMAINLLIGPANGLVVRPANGGSTLITYSASNGFALLSSQTLENIAPLPFTTLPSKCSADSGAVIYCFVPTNADFKAATLPDDYLERKVYTADSLYGIDTTTGNSAPIPLPANAVGKIDAEKPAFAGGNLYFVNRLDGYLYALNLGQD